LRLYIHQFRFASVSESASCSRTWALPIDEILDFGARCLNTPAMPRSLCSSYAACLTTCPWTTFAMRYPICTRLDPTRPAQHDELVMTDCNVMTHADAEPPDLAGRVRQTSWRRACTTAPVRGFG
jgi:hypothetical protein